MLILLCLFFFWYDDIKEHERFDEADREADEWRAREIAKDIVKRKVLECFS